MVRPATCLLVTFVGYVLISLSKACSGFGCSKSALLDCITSLIIEHRAVTSVVVTLPCLWYLLQPQLQAKEHGGGHGHDEHGEHGEESHEETEGEEGGAEDSKSEDKEQESNESQEAGDEGQEKEEQGDQGGDPGGDQSNDDSDSSSGEGQDTPETSEDEGSGDESSQSGKTTRNNNTIITYPDAKGGIKKRYQSNNAKVLGKADSEEQDPDNEDMVRQSGFASRRILIVDIGSVF